MPERPRLSPVKWLFGAAVAGYCVSAAATWSRYGRATYSCMNNELLSHFIPNPQVCEQFHAGVVAPADVAFEVACSLKLEDLIAVRTLFRAREYLMAGHCLQRKAATLPLLEQAKKWGWGLLAYRPGRELVFGAITQPWVARPVFRALPAAGVASDAKEAYVAIAWNIQAVAVDSHSCILRTTTLVQTSNKLARSKFRRYWALVRPGVVLIRLLALSAIKKQSEHLMKD